jgi:hypothetical protein
MILYNLTIKVEWQHNTELIDFLKKYIVETYTGSGSELLSLQNVDTSDGPTYCMQLKFQDMGTYNQHMIVNDAKMKQELHQTFGDKVVYFGSVLQTI